MLTVHLHYRLGAARMARLHAPCGHDERAGARDAAALLDGLLLPGAGCLPRGKARMLALCDRDALAAAVHGELFGDAIAADTRCEACAKDYEVRFSLAALAASRRPQMPEGVAAADEAEWFRLSDGVTFRLPRQADLDAVSGLPPEEAVVSLRERQVRATGEVDWHRVEAAMHALCPLLDCDLDAPCPYCRGARTIRFSVTRFLEQSLCAEQPLLVREVHCLARAYGWTHEAIMGLARAERRAFVALVTGEAAASGLLRRSA
jgi:hypothetical protein